MKDDNKKNNKIDYDKITFSFNDNDINELLDVWNDFRESEEYDIYLKQISIDKERRKIK